MAGRKDKNTVDYFPHYCISGKTMFILENQFGHLGYAVWFKTLELLGSNENHYIDLRDETDLLFLISKMKITEQQLNDIYNLLAKLSAIDLEMWNVKVIFSDNFINNISDAYSRRNKDVYSKEYLCEHILNLCIHKSNKGEQESADYTILKDTKLNNTINIPFNAFWNLYNKKVGSKEKLIGKWNKLTDEERVNIINYLPGYIISTLDRKFRKNPETFLNNKSWNDEIIKEETPGRKKTSIDFDQKQTTDSEYDNDPFLPPLNKTE